MSDRGLLTPKACYDIAADLWASSLQELDEARRNPEPSAGEIREAKRRRSVTVFVLDEDVFGGQWASGGLSGAVKRLSKYLASIPAQHRRSATFEVDSRSEYDSHCAHVTITYRRPETDDEFAERKADVQRRAATWAERRQAEERKEFERLKQKFG